MVLDFGKQHYHMGAEQLQVVSQAVHNGDISMIMRAYEKELKVRPILQPTLEDSFSSSYLTHLIYLSLYGRPF